MKKIGSWIKNNKFASFVIAIYTIIIVILLIAKANYSSSIGKPIYGDRLDDIKNLPIDKAKKSEEIKKGIKDNPVILKVDFDIRGRVLEFRVKVKDEVTREAAMAETKKLANYFSKKELEAYSINVIVYKEKNTEGFPFDGTKQHKDSDFVFSNFEKKG